MRKVLDGDGQTWQVEIVSHGRTSAYLNPKVHRPLVQFVCLTRTQPRRYAPLPVGQGDTLDDADDGELLRLLADAKPH